MSSNWKNKNLECSYLKIPQNAYFIGGYCSNVLHSACAIACKTGYKLSGSSYRRCIEIIDKNTNNSEVVWSGSETNCESILS